MRRWYNINEFIEKIRADIKERMKKEIEEAKDLDRLTDLVFALAELKRREFITEKDYEELKEIHKKRLFEVLG